MEEQECFDAGGTQLPEGNLCEWSACEQQPWACCLGHAQCVMLLPDLCAAQGGFPFGIGVDCQPNPCLVADAPDEPRVCTTWGRIKTIYR